jgi:hypothetical protein
MSNGRIHDTVVSGSSDHIGKLVTDGITSVRVWIQEVWPWRDATHVYKITNKAREDFRVIDSGMEVTHVRELSFQVKNDFVRAGLSSERCIPGTATRTVKTIEDSGRPIGERSVDKFPMRNAEDELATIKAVRADVLSAQPTAGSSFNFRERIEIFG